MVTMLHGEVWTTLEIRYLYGYIIMRKKSKIRYFIKKRVEDEYMAKSYETWSPTIGVLPPYIAISWDKRS